MIAYETLATKAKWITYEIAKVLKIVILPGTVKFLQKRPPEVFYQKSCS